ncbi:uncharacterized protein LOC143892270 isoform X2 [Tasmannia lanceolata]|uniref:uncharacterized protein LOC143892270 isoform X2 n=1 Tax=Tasmannia lanceolata TaxID=3420 RepID=UPI0040647D4F
MASEKPPRLKIAEKGTNPVPEEDISSLEEKEEKEDLFGERKRGRPPGRKKTRSVRAKKQKQVIDLEECPTAKKSKQAMVAEAIEGSTQPSLPTPTKPLTDQTDPIGKSPTDKGKWIMTIAMPLDEPGEENQDHSMGSSLSPPMTPPFKETPTTAETIGLITSLRQLIEGLGSPFATSPLSGSLEPEPNEVKKAIEVVKKVSSMDLESLLNEEYQQDLKAAIGTLLVADKDKTPGRSSSLLEFRDNVERLVFDFQTCQDDLKVAKCFNSQTESIKQILAKKIDRLEKFTNVDCKCDEAVDLAEKEKRVLQVKIEELQKQMKEADDKQKEVKALKASNMKVMGDLTAEVRKEGVALMIRQEDDKKWKAKEMKVTRDLKQIQEEWEEKKKLVYDIDEEMMEETENM